MTAEQQKLVVDYMPYATSLAGRYWRRNKPFGSSPEDLQAAAYLGLCRAARAFAPEKGFKFSTYAHHRILGAIRDCACEARASRGYLRKGRGPAGPAIVSLAEARRAAAPEGPPEISIRDQHAQLFKHLAALPERERMVVEAKMRGKSLREAGALIGVEKSWASRIYDRAINKLRRMYLQ